MATVTHTCAYGDDIIFSPTFIRYRNRLLDFRCVTEVKVKGRKLFINSYKQNKEFPTLCIHFKTTEDAKVVLDDLIDTWYYPPMEETSEVSRTPIMDWFFSKA
jgi:hypothetical protein